MPANEAADAEAVLPGPVAAGLDEVAAGPDDPEELQAASRPASVPASVPRLISFIRPMGIRLSRHPHYSQ